MKYAVKLPNGAYVSVSYGPVDYVDRRYANCMTRDLERAREVAAREGDSARVVRVLNAEETKRKATAQELRRLAAEHDARPSESLRGVEIAFLLGRRADELWPVKTSEAWPRVSTSRQAEAPKSLAPFETELLRCPACGHEHKHCDEMFPDAEDVDETRPVSCWNCGVEFDATRHVTVTFSAKTREP